MVNKKLYSTVKSWAIRQNNITYIPSTREARFDARAVHGKKDILSLSSGKDSWSSGRAWHLLSDCRIRGCQALSTLRGSL